MLKKTRLKLMLIKEVIDFDILDYLWINHSIRYAMNFFMRIVNLF